VLQWVFSYNVRVGDIDRRLGKLGINIPEILLPQATELGSWAVIACDQFTQDRQYWEMAEAAAGQFSTFNLIFPEVFLSDGDRAQRIEGIHRTMQKYVDLGVFAPPHRGLMYLERDTAFNSGRRGLVAAVDLEYYDWSSRDPKNPKALPLIRPTEGTVTERLPPRMDIRRGACLETSHVILLIDDETDTLLQRVGEWAKKTGPAYQGKLMLDSGGVHGWFLDTQEGLAFLADGLEELARRAVTRYLVEDTPNKESVSATQPFLFAVGDGNHSLASARGIWEEYKAGHSDGAAPQHPCRYALVEIENIYDPAIKFEPIHRVVFGLGFNQAINLLSALPGFSSREVLDRDDLIRFIAEKVKGNCFGIISGNHYALVETSASGIATASLQPLLDKSVSEAGDSMFIDYIHGEDELFRIVSGSGRKASGILLPPVQKAGFFETVARGGPLPRKSFSMGEAGEKRFYIECRRLFG
jgi:hypothetical protein